jgi:MFS family permease
VPGPFRGAPDLAATPAANEAGILLSPPPVGWRSTFSSLSNRDYALFWWAALVSNTGSFMQSVAVPFVIYQMTKSTTWLGFSAVASFIPAAAIGPVAGPLADRFNRRTILLVTQTMLMVIAFGLWGVWVAGIAGPGNILALVLLSGIVGGINIACWTAFVPLLVPRRDLLNALRLNGLQFTAARAFGPALAGVVLARFGAGVAFFVNAVTFLLVIFALLVVKPRANPTQHTANNFGRQFIEGAKYLFARQALTLGVVTVFMLTMLLSGLMQLAPAFATDMFGVGKAGYGIIVAIYGAGSIVGSLITASYGDRFSASAMSAVGIIVSVIGMIGLAASPNYGAGLAAILVMGAGYLQANVSLTTAIQSRVVESFRGRVTSLYLMANIGGTAVGALLLGRLAAAVGLRTTVVVACVLLAAYTLFVMARFDGMRAVNEVLEDPEDEAELLF